jgi:hypothetical protein
MSIQRPKQYRPANARCPALPVNIRPLESEEFAWTHSRRRGQCQNWKPLRFRGYVKNCGTPRRSEPSSPCASRAWRIDTDTKILCEHLPANCLAECGFQNGVGVLNCPGRQATVVHLGIETLRPTWLIVPATEHPTRGGCPTEEVLRNLGDFLP